jgi:hypothetical protein
MMKKYFLTYLCLILVPKRLFKKPFIKIEFYKLKFLQAILFFFMFSSSFVSAQEYQWEKVQDFISSQPYSVSAADSNMGYALDVNGDYAVVGLPGPHSEGGGGGNGHHGLAYVLKKVAGNWQVQAAFRPNLDESINFGIEVAMSDNLIAIGAVSGQNFRESRVFLYEKSNGEWQDAEPVAVLKGKNYYDKRSFGGALDISDELVVVGSIYYTLDRGGIYVYEKPLSGWSDVDSASAILELSSAHNGGNFAQTVKIVDDMILSMMNSPSTLLVYEKSSSQWGNMTESQAIDLSIPLPYQYKFHIEADGTNVVIAGPSYSWQESGAVLVMERSGSVFNQTQLIQRSGVLDVRFGALTAIEDNNLIILSTGENGSTDETDTLYFYEKNASSQWQYVGTHAMNNQRTRNFNAIGERMTLQNGQLFMGFPEDDSKAENAGAFHEYALSSGAIDSIISSVYPQDSDSLDYAYLGQSVALEGDIAVVGAPGEDSYRGAAYIFQKVNNQWQSLAKLVPPGLSSWSDFGATVAISGDTIAIGAPMRKDPSVRGKVYIYKKPLSGWQQMDANYEVIEDISVLMDGEKVLDNYGKSLDLFEDRLAVGGNGYNDSRVLVYELGQSQANQVQALSDSSNNFGRALKWIDSGQRLVVASDANLITVYADYDGNWSKQALLVSSDILARFSNLQASNDWIIGGSYSNFSNSGEINTFMFKKPDIGWRNMNENQMINHSGRYSKDGASIALDGNTLAIWANNELGVYEAVNDQWQQVQNTQIDYPYVGVYIDRSNGFEYPVNNMVLQGGTLLSGRFWEDTVNGIFAGRVDEYKKKLTATLTLADINKKLSDGLFTLSAISNSTGSISYSIVGGDASAITLNGNLVEMHHTGTVQIQANQESDDEYASSSVIATLTIEKGQAVITNFNDMTLFKGFPAVTLNAQSNSDGAISYAPLAFIAANGTFDMGLDLVNADQLTPLRAGTLYLRASVAETDQYESDVEIIVVVIVDL